MLHLFSFFHLNLAFSSIEEELRREVIRRCYWPLLRLIGELDLPVGIEASGYTLEKIQSIDPTWLEQLKELCRDGSAEFIGSGYCQIIGPLVPAAVNRANQRIGMQVYQGLLGVRPRIALVNEQAYSAGLVPIYREAGYRALIMEWDNPGCARPGWSPDWRYLPQYACGADGSVLPVIWNKSISFQKFQRYAHGEIDLAEYLDFLGQCIGAGDRTFSLYGNDAEIFDFRPGRFQAEAVLGTESEWTRIVDLYKAIRADGRFALIRPSQVLDFMDLPGAGNRLQLESAAQPVPVKKQAKYNVVRWALTGRDDLGLNTACWRSFEELKQRPDEAEEEWKELCYLWSSDFRTHITSKRWEALQRRLAARDLLPAAWSKKGPGSPSSPDRFQVQMKGAFLEIETPHQRIRLNCRRGLAVDGWWDKSVSEKPLVRTLPHGYFDDIRHGADFYTGHFVLEIPGRHKITDLSPVSPDWEALNGDLVVRVELQTSLGPVHKEIVVNGNRAGFELVHIFRWPTCPNGTLRIGHITLNPEVFARESLWYGTHNGGEVIERFPVDQPINHLAPVSTLVSASQGLGMTEGIVEMGDLTHRLRVEVDKTAAAVTGHVIYSPVYGSYFYRLVLSAMEMDETAYQVVDRNSFSECSVRLRLSSGDLS